MPYPFTKGLHEIGRGVYAYLQPDGSWGWSNAGLIVYGGSSLLVDTLFDLSLTREMLDAMAPLLDNGRVDSLVITHANGDHCYGNELVAEAEIIASTACALEMKEMTPQAFDQILKAAPGLGLGGAYLAKRFKPFTFTGITLTLPTRTFENTLDIVVGGMDVRLMNVGPAHTRGDILVHVPSAKALFAGDILFIRGTPIMWAGPVCNWIRALDIMLDLDVDAFVPGHGPVTDKKGVVAVKRYFEYITREARLRFDNGMSVADAARDIPLKEFGAWTESERIVVNVNTLYREFSGESAHPNLFDMFSRMAVLTGG